MKNKLESIFYLERRIRKLDDTIENLIEDNIKLKEEIKKITNKLN
jgi:hypothetical protein